MPIPLVVPVMMICLIETVPGTGDGLGASLAKQEIRGCAYACKPSEKDCEVPPAFQKFVADTVDKALQKAAKVSPEKKTKPTKRVKRRR